MLSLRVHQSRPFFGTKRKGYTLAELIVTIAIIGVLIGVAIPIYSNVRNASEETVAMDHVEAMNGAVMKYSQECWKFPTAPSATGTNDEYAVLRSLQYRFPNLSNGAPGKAGSPFFNPNYDPRVSSNSSDLRIRWNGKSFELLKRGQSGTGLKYDNGNDLRNTPYSFPPGYKPEGAG